MTRFCADFLAQRVSPFPPLLPAFAPKGGLL